MAAVTKPRPITSPEASPALEAMSCCAISSMSGAVDAARKPIRIAEPNAQGPGKAVKRRIAGMLSTSVPMIRTLRPKRSASAPTPTVPAALASTSVVASGP